MIASIMSAARVPMDSRVHCHPGSCISCCAGWWLGATPDTTGNVLAAVFVSTLVPSSPTALSHHSTCTFLFLAEFTCASQLSVPPLMPSRARLPTYARTRCPPFNKQGPLTRRPRSGKGNRMRNPTSRLQPPPQLLAPRPQRPVPLQLPQLHPHPHPQPQPQAVVPRK